MRITNTLRRALVAGVAAVFGLGLFAIGSTASDQREFVKRDEEQTELALVADDDDDTDDNTDGTFNSGTGDSNDATNSRVTRVTRDGEPSRDDLTRDRTRDGNGVLKRDWSDNRTNDASRNDSRASRKTGDRTLSNYSAVSRDRDISRADLTKDYTDDGPGGIKRDFSRNLTNDSTRNDTR